MKDAIAKVKEFHRVYKCPIGEKPSSELVTRELRILRDSLLQEEVDELKDAEKVKDLVEITDALADILYIVYGTAITYGLEDVLPLAFDEVHRSNMSKLDEHGNPIFRIDGKVLKGLNYTPPNIKQFLE